MKNGVLGLEPNNNTFQQTEISTTTTTTTTATSTTKQNHQQSSNNNKDMVRKQNNTNPRSNTSSSQSRTSTVHRKTKDDHPITKRHQPNSFQSDGVKMTQLGSSNKETPSQNKNSFKDKPNFKNITIQSNQSNPKAAMPLKETTSQSKINDHPVTTPKLNRFQIAAAATSSSPPTPILDCEGNEEPTYVNYSKDNSHVSSLTTTKLSQDQQIPRYANFKQGMYKLESNLKENTKGPFKVSSPPYPPRFNIHNKTVEYANFKKGIYTPEITSDDLKTTRKRHQSKTYINLPPKTSTSKVNGSSMLEDGKNDILEDSNRLKYVDILIPENRKDTSLNQSRPISQNFSRTEKTTSSNNSQNDFPNSIRLMNGSLNRSRNYSKISRSTEDTLNHHRDDTNSNDSKFRGAFKRNGIKYAEVSSLRSVSTENILTNRDDLNNNKFKDARDGSTLRSASSSTSLRKTSITRLGNAFRELRRHTVNSRRLNKSQQQQRSYTVTSSSPKWILQQKQECQQNGEAKKSKNQQQQVSRSLSLPNIKNNVEKENRRNAKKSSINTNSLTRKRGSVSKKQANQNRSTPAILEFDSVDIISFPSERLNGYRSKSKDGSRKQTNQNRSTPAILEFDSVDIISFPSERLNGYRSKSKDGSRKQTNQNRSTPVILDFESVDIISFPSERLNGYRSKSRDGMFFTPLNDRKNSSSANECFTDNDDDDYDENDERSMADKIRERQNRGRSRSVQLMPSDTVRKNVVTRERSFSTDCDEHLFSFDKLVERRLNSSKETQLCETDL